ncbi:MAG: GAF domain-containing protein [Anaerolineae bacterium]|nr:GAF domain-containing protein [Anaerolineae bacterium]
MTTSHDLNKRLTPAVRLAVFCRLAHELNADLRPIDVLRRVLHSTAELLGTPHASMVALRGHTIEAVYALGGDANADPEPVMKRVLRDGLAGYVLHNYRTAVIPDISREPLWLPMSGESLSPQEGSALCIPLIHAGDIVGVMSLAHPLIGYFGADAVELANTIANMAAAALSYAMLLDQTRQAQQRYASLFDNTIIPIIITDLKGNIQSANLRACDFLGYSRAELNQQNIFAIHRMGTGPILSKQFDYLQHGHEIRFRSVAWAKDGTNRTVQVFAKRIGNGRQGDYIQWIEHDLSSQLTLDRLRQDLSAMVYHDMRGPLSNIYTSLKALKTMLRDHDNDNVKDLLDIALRSERQVRRMVDTLLDVQRLEAGSKLVTRQNNQVAAVVAGAIEQIKAVADEKQIRLRIALADDLPMLYIDNEMIERVVLNLLDNAIKYTPDRGVITVSIAASGNEVYFRVKDTGPGIPPEAQATIFDKFSRVKHRNNPHGIGLGLAFCKMAVEAHGGRIWVHSDNGSGSVFTFALPVNAPATKELTLAKIDVAAS